MAYTKRQWANDNISAPYGPIDGGRLNALETAVEQVKTADLDIADFGAVVGTSDSATAINAAITALPTEGGTILVNGQYSYASTLNMEGRRDILIKGKGGRSAGASTKSQLTFTGSAARGINCRSSFGIAFEDIHLLYNNAAFTGDLVDYSWSAAAVDSAYGNLHRCTLSGSGVRTARSLLCLDNAITCTARSCLFAHAVNGVYGASSNLRYSNAHSFEDCTFINNTASHIRNLTQGWSVVGCTFEALYGGGMNCIARDTGIDSVGVLIAANWCGDFGVTGTVFDLKGSGINVIGNYIPGVAGPLGIGINIGASSFGVNITGNQFTNLVTGIVSAANVNNARYVPNDYQGVTTKCTMGTIPAAADIEYPTASGIFRYMAGTGATSGISFNGGPQLYYDATDLRLNYALRIESKPLRLVDAAGCYVEMLEQTADPAAPAANTGRLFTKDNGAGKTQLAVRFASGATQVIATEP